MPKSSRVQRGVRWDDPPPLKQQPRPARLVAFSFVAGVTLAGGVAAAVLTLVPAGAEQQAVSLPQEKRVHAQARSLAPALPVKTVKTVAIAAPLPPAEPAPARPPAPDVSPAAAPVPARPVPPADMARLVSPAPDRWAAEAEASVDAANPTSAAIDAARFAALSMLPVVAAPVIVEPSSAAEDPKAEAEPAAKRRARMARSANLRARPANGGKLLTTLSAGTPVSLLGCAKGWCEVSAENRRGFVAERFLKGGAAKAKAKAITAKRKTARKPKPAAEAPAVPPPAQALPGVFPQPGISQPNDR